MATWKMPKWMEQYLPIFTIEGDPKRAKQFIEEMVNDETQIQINAPRVRLSCVILGEVRALIKLWESGLLVKVNQQDTKKGLERFVLKGTHR